MRFHSLTHFALMFLMLLPSVGLTAVEERNLEKSAYFAYVGRDYIFTIEIVGPGMPLFNFVSMTDSEEQLRAQNIRLTLGNRQVDVKLFAIEPDSAQQPLKVSSLRMRPRSSFGFMLEGSFGEAKEIYGAEIELGKKNFKLAPLHGSDFDTLVQKVNQLNLESPDFRDDFRVLNLELTGQSSFSAR